MHWVAFKSNKAKSDFELQKTPSHGSEITISHLICSHADIKMPAYTSVCTKLSQLSHSTTCNTRADSILPFSTIF